MVGAVATAPLHSGVGVALVTMFADDGTVDLAATAPQVTPASAALSPRLRPERGRISDVRLLRCCTGFLPYPVAGRHCGPGGRLER